MCPSTKTTCGMPAKWKLGLLFLSVLLLLFVAACASPSSRITQTFNENQEEYLTVPTSNPAPKQAPPKQAPKPRDNRNPLEVCAVVPEEDLQEMRGTLGVYFFDYNFDINLVTNPQVSITTNFSAAVPDGSPSPTFNGASAVFQDNNVSYIAGPTGGGLMSQVMVTGRDNIVFANTQFNIHLPNAATLTPTIRVLPAASLSGIGVK